MKLSSTLSPPNDEEGCHGSHQRSGRIDSGEVKRSAESFPQENSHRKDKLLPNFYITILIHEIRKQQRSKGTIRTRSVSLERLT